MSVKSIKGIESKIHAVFSELRFSESVINSTLAVARRIVRLHDEKGAKQLNPKIVASYIKHQESRYQDNEIGRCLFLERKRAAERLSQIYHNGMLIEKQHKRLPALSGCFEQILSSLLSNEEWTPKHRKHQYNHAIVFFRWLQFNNYNDMNNVDEHVVRAYFAECAEKMVGYSLDNRRRALKKLFLFLSEDGVLSEEMNKLFLFKVPIEKKIKPFMPQDEIAAVLNAIDRSTACGKRDYAAILLATVMGLRKIDIAELALDSIDWSNGEIRIVQEKTGKALALPLTADVGEAIHEYICTARPHSYSDKVFLSTRMPFAAMHIGTLNKILKRYCIAAGLETHWSPHSLRRGLATSMVASGVSVITVAQALGHGSIDSTQQYISLDSRNLKECALDFSGISVGGDGL